MIFSVPILCWNTIQKCPHLPMRSFYLTHAQRLKTLFSEDEQRKITTFINDFSTRNMLATGKLRSLKKIVSCLPELGPLKDVNDLLEKHNMSSVAAVNVCRNILKTDGNPSPEPDKSKPVRIFRSRKLSSLKKAVSPEVSKFLAVTLSGNCVSFVVLEKEDTNWCAQLVSNWNTIGVSTVSVTESLIQMFATLPVVDHNVLQTIPTRGKNYVMQTKLYGGLLAIICAKHNFSNDVSNQIYEMSSRDSASHFNFIVGNEIVSSQPMVSSAIFDNSASTSDDHVFRKSLREVRFTEYAKERFAEYDYDRRESLCQSLVLGKTFAELMKVKKI